MSSILNKTLTRESHPKGNERMHSETDVLIVGGGPAGLAASIALRQRGLQCTVVEARSPGIDKACGEGLMPETLNVLASLGVDLRIKPRHSVQPDDGFAFKGIRFANSCNTVEADFPSGTGLGLRRPILHGLLADKAQAAGVHLHWHSRVQLAPRVGSAAPSANINGQPIRFRWLIGADGHSSSVRRWAGLGAIKTDRVRFGFRRHYRVAPWSNFVEVHWCATGQLYITPVAADCVCVVFVTRTATRTASGRDMLDAFPEIHHRLQGAPILSQQRGAVSATRKLHRVHDEHVALVGDASGSADAITGEGLAMSFRHALVLAAALASGSLAGYGPAHARIGRLPLAMGALMLQMDRWPALQGRALRALSANPNLFCEMLSVHVGARSPTRFAFHHGPQLGWNLLVPKSLVPDQAQKFS